MTVRSDDTLRAAGELMRQHGVSHLVVVSNGEEHPVGILSTLDIARVLGEVPWPRPESLARCRATYRSSELLFWPRPTAILERIAATGRSVRNTSIAAASPSSVFMTVTPACIPSENDSTEAAEAVSRSA